MLRRSTTSSVAFEHKNRSLVNTRIPRYPAATWLPRHPLAVSPWEYSIANRSPWGGSLAIRCLVVRRLTLRSLPNAMRRVPTSTLPVGKLPRYPLVACYIAVLSLHLRKMTHTGLHSVVSLPECYALPNVRHSSRQRRPSLSVLHKRKLWCSH
jgi:hypothetical protein